MATGAALALVVLQYRETLSLIPPQAQAPCRDIRRDSIACDAKSAALRAWAPKYAADVAWDRAGKAAVIVIAFAVIGALIVLPSVPEDAP